jgi:hypothetical protein
MLGIFLFLSLFIYSLLDCLGPHMQQLCKSLNTDGSEGL